MEVPFVLQGDTFDKQRYWIIQKRQDNWKNILGWAYDFPWRIEQKEILSKFQEDNWTKFIIQAVFGGGKTTMIIAMIYDLILREKCNGDEIMICAFNVAIKNEIKKKLKVLRKIIPRTFDSIVYEICALLNYKDLKHPNFLQKRQFLYHNLLRIPENKIIKYVFIDESQDLERNVEKILKKRFPEAKFVIVGDIFQSIQKEPRESLLWTLLNNKNLNETEKLFTMLNTPRVPKSILSEVQLALANYYPEHQDTITNWSSSSEIDNTEGIEWFQFTKYNDLYKEMYASVMEKGIENCMILVFSSAITVRGSLGDVSRVRRYFTEKNIPVNSNHKLMKDDSLFISTVNSSKGLERDYVICMLSFPLELAFANFSSDILMNLVTVAMSRCKRKMSFYISSFKDRFSPIVSLYKKCPIPIIETKRKDDKNIKKENFLSVEDYQKKSYLLQKEHSVTEILRLGILDFNTKQSLLSFKKKYKQTDLPQCKIKVYTEEESTLLGLIFETLILTEWNNNWLKRMNTEINHIIFDSLAEKINSKNRDLIIFERTNNFQASNDYQKLKYAILYSQLHIAVSNKVFCETNKKLEKEIYEHWQKIKHIMKNMNISNRCNLKYQHNVRLPYINGIIDALYLNDDIVDIVEIKVSKQREWRDNALIQSILYGLSLHKNRFRIHLINILSKKCEHFYVNFSKTITSNGELLRELEQNIKDENDIYESLLNDIIMEMIGNVRTSSYTKELRKISNDIQMYNMNCFLAKTLTNNVEKEDKIDFDITNVFFLDGRIYRKEIQVLHFYELTSPTRVTLHFQLYTRDEIIDFLKKFKKIVNCWGIEKIIVGRHLLQEYLPFKNEIPYEFLNKDNIQMSEKNWNEYLLTANWEETENNIIDWNNIVSSSAVQITEMSEKYNFKC
tara:strand:+ start:1147 stop:3855 length:2709 start_codon:yes stop_codon:yes gene_type:complete